MLNVWYGRADTHLRLQTCVLGLMILDACTMLHCCHFATKFVQKLWLQVSQLCLLQHACRAHTQDIATHCAVAETYTNRCDVLQRLMRAPSSAKSSQDQLAGVMTRRTSKSDLR
jgi:hypothetical protein